MFILCLIFQLEEIIVYTYEKNLLLFSLRLNKSHFELSWQNRRFVINLLQSIRIIRDRTKLIMNAPRYPATAADGRWSGAHVRKFLMADKFFFSTVSSFFIAMRLLGRFFRWIRWLLAFSQYCIFAWKSSEQQHWPARVKK